MESIYKCPYALLHSYFLLQYTCLKLTDDQIKDLSLLEIMNHLIKIKLQLSENVKVCLYLKMTAEMHVTYQFIVDETTSNDKDIESEKFNLLFPRLIEEQCTIYDKIISFVNSGQG